MEGNTQNISHLSNGELALVLQKLVSNNPNNEVLKHLNEVVKKYCKNISSVEGFLYQVQNNPNIKSKQLAAVLLKRKIERFWVNLDPKDQVTLRNIILGFFTTEKNFLVLKAIANLVIKIAKINLINGQWDEVLEFIFTDPSKFSQEQAQLFELNLYIISELIETCHFHLKSKLPEIKNIMLIALNQGSNKMKENATKCLGNLVRSLEQVELNLFKDVIPCIFKEIKNFTEETISHIFETFCDFHVNSLVFFEPYFEIILPLTNEFLLSNEFSGLTKLVLSEFLLMLAECKKKLFTKNGCEYLKMVIATGYRLASYGDIDSPDEEMEDMSNTAIGNKILENFSQVISSKYVFPLCSDAISKLVTSNNKFERKAAIVSIGSIAEGCNEKVRDILPDLVKLLVDTFFKDENSIKGACIVSMDYLTIHCSPDINEYYDQILPMLIKGLDYSDEDIVEKSLIEINYFCRNLDVELEDYTNELFNKLVILLKNHKSVKVQQQSLFALASVIGSAQNLNLESLIAILNICKDVIHGKTGEEEMELRANAMECVAQICFVVKLDSFKPFMEYFNTIASEYVKTETYELQEAGFAYFGSLANIMGSNFAEFLPPLMELALKTLKDNSGITESKNKDEFGLDSDSEEDEEEQIVNGKVTDVYVVETFVDAKCSVITALCNFAKACPKQFIDYLKDIFLIFDGLWDYVHENVNLELIMAQESIIKAVDEAENIVKTEASPQNFTEKVSYRLWVNDIFPKFKYIVNERDTKEEVVKVLESIYQIIDHFEGQLFVGNNSLQGIIEICNTLLKYDAVCQLKNEDEAEDEGDIDHDEQILSGVTDLFLILSEKLQNEFHPFFAQSFQNFQKYLNVSRSEADRSMIFGCIADVLKNCKISTKLYIDTVMKYVKENMGKTLKKKHDELHRHIAYLLGILFESDSSAASNYFTDILQYLQTIYENSGKMSKDNVIAALCRITYNCNLTSENSFYEQITTTVLKSIPLQNDSLENPTVFKFLIFLADKLDINSYNTNFDNIMSTIKLIVLSEIKCGTSKQLLKDVKSYLELLNNNEILKLKIEAFLNTMSNNERERFVNTIRNA